MREAFAAAAGPDRRCRGRRRLCYHWRARHPGGIHDRRLRAGPGAAQSTRTLGSQDPRLPGLPGPRAAPRRRQVAARAPRCRAGTLEGHARQPRAGLHRRRPAGGAHPFRPPRPPARRPAADRPLQRLRRLRVVRSGEDQRARAAAALRLRPRRPGRRRRRRAGDRRSARSGSARFGRGAGPGARPRPGAGRQMAPAPPGHHPGGAGDATGLRPPLRKTTTGDPTMDVIQYHDPDGQTMVARVPPDGTWDIRLGSQLIVEESQQAVFFRDGKALDTFGPGRHTLATQNVPILTRLLSIPFGGTSPFQAAVVFVSMKTFLDLKWGTKEPVIFRDKDLAMVRLRAFGKFAVRIANPQVFVNTIVGSRGAYSADGVESYFRDVIVARLNDLLGENLTSIFDLPKVYDELSLGLKSRVADDFSKYGIELTDLFLGAITPPEEVQKMIDERSGMGALGDLNAYLKFKTARAIGDAAQQQGDGGTVGAGMSLGMGAGMGAMLPGMMREAMSAPAAPAPAAAAPAAAAAPVAAAPAPAAAGATPAFCS